MVRIYLDKQIFSHLFHRREKKYLDFYNYIIEKGSSLFVYSHAHLLDLLSDKSPIKYDELDFMHTIVGDNYLQYNSIDKETIPLLAKPREAFKTTEENKFDSNWFQEFEEDLNDTNLSAEERRLNKLMRQMLNLKHIEPGIDYSQITDEKTLKSVNAVFPESNGPMSIMDMAKQGLDLVDILKKDQSVYKDLRHLTDSYFNQGKFKIQYDEINFNKDFLNSPLKKSFLDYVEDALNPDGNKQISRYKFLTFAYMNLDMLGVTMEPAKKVKFNNLLNDSMHAYYGAYTESVVSDDQYFLKKTRVMYKLCGIDTKVFSMNEFLKTYRFSLNKLEETLFDFIKLLLNDLKNGLVINDFESLRFNRHTTSIKPVHEYLGFFNRLDICYQEGETFFTFFRVQNNYSNFRMLREFELVINQAFKIFGYDESLRGSMDWKKEKDEMKKSKWPGRLWHLDIGSIVIEYNLGIHDIGMIFRPNKWCFPINKLITKPSCFNFYYPRNRFDCGIIQTLQNFKSTFPNPKKQPKNPPNTTHPNLPTSLPLYQ